MQLYRITYDQLTLISTFDSQGIKIGDREERVRVSMHDLPLQTAQSYREKMPGLNFVMEAQLPGDRDEPRAYRRKHESRSNASAPAARPAQPSKHQQINQAATSGDLSAAINMRIK